MDQKWEKSAREGDAARSKSLEAKHHSENEAESEEYESEESEIDSEEEKRQRKIEMEKIMEEWIEE